MKITRRKLKQIIKEELGQILNERDWPTDKSDIDPGMGFQPPSLADVGRSARENFEDIDDDVLAQGLTGTAADEAAGIEILTRNMEGSMQAPEARTGTALEAELLKQRLRRRQRQAAELAYEEGSADPFAPGALEEAERITDAILAKLLR